MIVPLMILLHGSIVSGFLASRGKLTEDSSSLRLTDPISLVIGAPSPSGIALLAL